MQAASDTRKNSYRLGYWLIGVTYVVASAYLFFISPQTGFSPLKNLAVAGILTLMVASNVGVVMFIAGIVIRIIKKFL
jgi:hypothetical protein